MTVTIPSTSEELEAMLLDDDQIRQVFADGQLGPFIQAYAQASHQRDQSIAEQIRNETQRVVADMLRDEPDSIKRVDLNPYNGPHRYAPKQNPRAVGAPLNGLFEDFGSYLQAVWYNANPSADVQAKLTQLRNYQEKVPSEGGFLVPEEFRAELLRMSLESSIVRPRARVVPMSSETLRYPAIDETSHASSVFGGIIVYRTEEGAELTESAASFGSIKLEATKQTALAHVTNELLRDAAGGFAQYVEQSFPEAMAYFEDVDFLSGNGVGQPLGAIAAQNQAIIVVSKESGQAADTIVWENVLKMYARMLPQSLGRAVWVASQDTFPELATMALSVGTGGSAVWLTDGRSEPVLTLLGRPVVMSEKASKLGDQGDLSFVDFGFYLIGDRQMVTVDSSPHVKFTSDKTTFRVIARNDGQPWVRSAITPRNAGPTLSPFVQLEAR